MSILTKPFWAATFERAVKTTAQTGAALLVGTGSGLLDADWTAVFSVAAMAGVVSVLTSIGSDALTDGTGPSLTNAETIPAVGAPVPAEIPHDEPGPGYDPPPMAIDDQPDLETWTDHDVDYQHPDDPEVRRPPRPD